MTQIPLSDTQATILSAACARDDGIVFPVITTIKGGAVGNVLKSLLKKGLIEEIRACDDMTVWRHGDDGTPLTLRATPTAYAVLGIDSPMGASDAPEGRPATANTDTDEAPSTSAPRAGKARADSKQALLIEMLKRHQGSSIEEIVEKFGWQPHTVRGAIAGALKKKLGLDVISEKVEGRGRVYRIAG